MEKNFKQSRRNSVVGQGIIEVCCVVLPTAETLWFKTKGKSKDYLRELLRQWRKQHPEFDGTECSSGAVLIHMPENNYRAIQAKSGRQIIPPGELNPISLDGSRRPGFSVIPPGQFEPVSLDDDL